MENRTALVFGATGLVGGYLLEELVNIDVYQKITVFSRREPLVKNEKIKVILNNLENLEEISELITGHDLFCCLGTTIKKAGSQEAFKKVDLLLPSKLAEIGSRNHVHNFVVISSIGAKENTRNFYLQVKGLMEQEVMKYSFEHIVIVRPSLLLGDRQEYRFGESAGKTIMPLINLFLNGRLRKYRPIHGRNVAKAMISLALFPRKQIIYESDELNDLLNTTTL